MALLGRLRNDSLNPQIDKALVRSVRNDTPTSITRYILANEGATVIDQVAGLMWVRNPADAGLSGNYNWVAGIHACESLGFAGFDDWRLPNRNELISLVDYGRSRPATPALFVAAGVNPFYMISTTYFFNTSRFWAVNFGLGQIVHLEKDNSPPSMTKYDIRPVRSLVGNVADGWQKYE
jgi:hypothetical protein